MTALRTEWIGIFRFRVSAVRRQVQEFRFRYWSLGMRPYLMPVPEPAAATCDLERFLSTNR